MSRLDPARVEALVAYARSQVGPEGLSSAQLALGHRSEVVCEVTLGDAAPEARYLVYSATKAVIAGAVWRLLEAGRLAVDTPVGERVPDLQGEGFERLQLWHLLTHTAGLPNAPFAVHDWPEVAVRRQRFASWRLEWEPGTRFVYHTGSASWLLAEVIEQVTGQDYRTFVQDSVLRPLEMDFRIGGSPAPDAMPVAHLGNRPDATSLARMGLDVPTSNAAFEGYLETYNQPAVRAIGSPGGGGVGTAGALARFYQGVLAGKLWASQTLERALRASTGELRDPATGKRAHRGLGVALAGDGDRVYRAFGASNSPAAFGHAGAGGQIGWGDPATGLSFAFLTNTLDRDLVRLGIRMGRLSTLAAMCAQ